MSILRMRILVLLGELKKVTAVADEIGVKQPTVSFHMRKLEEEWGAPLFEIKTGKVLLTEPGKMLYRYAVEINKLYKEAESRFQTFREHGKHGFVIGSTDAASSLLFGRDWHVRVSDAAPMRVQLRTAPHDMLLEQLLTGAIDLLVSSGFSARGAMHQLTYEDLGEERLLLFMGEQHPLAGSASIPPYKLAGYRFVELADASLQEALRVWEQHEKLSLAFDWSTDRVDLALGAAENGGSLTVLPASAALRAGGSVQHAPLPGRPVALQLTAAWRADYWNLPLLQRVVGLITKTTP
ncbi:LysR family transcriptional regulator [Paenibacillus sp. GCM10023250]|uniref:LysR family transcriptional regulator n=1 Tax=Paenibacillus sp. GCM10023250 TaxID=3252648 RepID=UPI0036227F58